LRKIPVSRECEGGGRPLTSANQFGHGGISAWLAIAVFALSQVATQAQAQSTTGDSGFRVEHQVSPRTLSRLLLIAATSAGNRLVAVGEQGYVVYSDDQGKTWLRGSTPRRAMLTAVAFVDEKTGWAVGHDGQILASQDGGATWTEQRYKPDDKQPLFAVRFSDREHGFALGAYGLFLETADGGKTWAPRAILQEDKHLYAVASDAAGRMAIAAEAGTLLMSADQGRTWEPAASPYKGSFFGLVTTADGALLAYGLRGNIFKSGDFGKTWTQSASEGTATLQGGARLASGEIVLVGSAGAVLSSRDNGASFQRVAGQRAMTYSAVLPTATGALLFGEAGVVPYAPAAGAAAPPPDAANKTPAKGAP
jgi:photosystem II stability/assembly factor-like uncharacterized protein